MSSSSFEPTDRLGTTINPRLYCTSNEFLIVTTDDYEIGSMRVVRINRKTGEVFNPATREWRRYGFANEEAVNEIKTFTKDMNLKKIISRLGEPYWMVYFEDGGLLLHYGTQEGSIHVELKNGYFEKYRIVDNMTYL